MIGAWPIELNCIGFVLRFEYNLFGALYISFIANGMRATHTIARRKKIIAKRKNFFIRYHYHYTIHKWHHLESINCVWMDFWFQRMKVIRKSFSPAPYSFRFGLSFAYAQHLIQFSIVRNQNILHPKIDKASVLQFVDDVVSFVLNNMLIFLLVKWECETISGDFFRRDKALSMEL